jgi:hypothetical protein
MAKLKANPSSRREQQTLINSTSNSTKAVAATAPANPTTRAVRAVATYEPLAV